MLPSFKNQVVSFCITGKKKDPQKMISEMFGIDEEKINELKEQVLQRHTVIRPRIHAYMHTCI